MLQGRKMRKRPAPYHTTPKHNTNTPGYISSSVDSQVNSSTLFNSAEDIDRSRPSDDDWKNMHEQPHTINPNLGETELGGGDFGGGGAGGDWDREQDSSRDTDNYSSDSGNDSSSDSSCDSSSSND